MTDDNRRYLTADESRQVNEYTQQYLEDPPEFADPILDPLDLSIMRSEGLPTLETTNALAYARRVEAERRVQGGAPIPERVRASIAADDCLADLDDCLADHVRGNAPLAEDGGAAHLEAAYAEIEAGEKLAKQQRERAEKAAKQTAARFAGFKYQTVTPEQMSRRRKG
jgi:hypothetical protein